VDEWFELRKLFNDNNVKATFFISEPATLSKSEIDKLKILEKEGHEIGFHGTMHVLSEYYIQEHSYKDYLEKEIDVGLKQMDSLGFKCVSFAYPYGAKYWFTDFLLLRRFEILRSVSPINKTKKISLIDDIYYSFDGDNTVSAIGIDNNAGVDESMINEGLERTIKRNQVLMLYGLFT
jgi:peptidoglycan-N-acetylglucosamine deacetylase